MCRSLHERSSPGRTSFAYHICPKSALGRGNALCHLRKPVTSMRARLALPATTLRWRCCPPARCCISQRLRDKATVRASSQLTAGDASGPTGRSSWLQRALQRLGRVVGAQICDFFEQPSRDSSGRAVRVATRCASWRLPLSAARSLKFGASAERAAAVAYNQVLSGMEAAQVRFLASSIEGDERNISSCSLRWFSAWTKFDRHNREKHLAAAKRIGKIARRWFAAMSMMIDFETAVRRQLPRDLGRPECVGMRGQIRAAT